MKKILKISSLIILWAFASFGVWFVILSVYEFIATPEAFTKFEMFMSALVSLHIGEELLDLVFEAQKEGAEE